MTKLFQIFSLEWDTRTFIRNTQENAESRHELNKLQLTSEKHENNGRNTIARSPFLLELINVNKWTISHVETSDSIYMIIHWTDHNNCFIVSGDLFVLNI